MAVTAPIPTVDTLTRTQAHALNYLRAFFSANHCLPPCSVMARDMGWRSPNAANECMDLLEARGMLERNELGGRKFTQAGLLGVIVNLT